MKITEDNLYSIASFLVFVMRGMIVGLTVFGCFIIALFLYGK